ncbi:MAG: class II fumarate hydratase [Cyanobacteriota bacterium]|uniref:class II fumarate hydratase n=1 Tax=Prochlorococcus sp. MIT 1306 TaxID=1799667 RepID=UPI0007B333E9|nr:class II fumarate hydratase [Prochlorococcus sp. MIT 1306]KZR63275.1 Fumarate hydratase class II [Prochlorococcus sp. MIT 1306]MED5562244.1 class II fumarate hydratase [Cyanobacteriota bacterium]
MADLMRIEHDSMGTVEVPAGVLWGAQTQRSLLNFAISTDRMPVELIHALALIKQAAASVNCRLGVLDEIQRDQIIKAASAVASGLHDDQFPLRVWQTGSGTHTNMNVNEVISNLASQANDEPLGSHRPVHPNDHVNRSQSTNDAFPTAIHIAAVQGITKNLLPELERLIAAFARKSNAWSDIIKIGRTHLQDAVPLTLGQEASAWRDQIASAHSRIQSSLIELYPLPLGGTAVGTGLNAPARFGQETAAQLASITGLPFSSAKNKFAVMASHDGLVNAMAQLRMLAVALFKISNDLRLLACGPRAGLAELHLPENEPGSSIMPGKVNPSQCEAMAMVCLQVIGLDSAVTMAGGSGHLQMNVYKPLIGFNLLHSIELLHDACRNYRLAMVQGIEPNRIKIQHDLEQSLMLVTALAPEIGYDKASEIAHLAHEKGFSLREAALKLGYVSKEDFDRIVNPALMTSARL